MSATLRLRCQTSLGAGSRCKGTTKFAIVQILSGKSFKSFMGDLGFREKKKPFMRVLHKWQK
mgnify:FL=1